MKRSWMAVLMLLFTVPLLPAQSKERERLEQCGIVMKEILDVPDAIPAELLDKAECVVVFPSVKKFAIGLGGSYGRGAMICRGGADYRGPWGPGHACARGGEYRLPAGRTGHRFRAADHERQGAKSVLKSKVKLGADAAPPPAPRGAPRAPPPMSCSMPKSSATPVRVGCLRASRSKAPPCAPTGGQQEPLWQKLDAEDIILKGRCACHPRRRPWSTSSTGSRRRIFQLAREKPGDGNEPCWTRTSDPLLKRQMLCRLS